MRINNYAVYTLYSGFYYWNIFEKHMKDSNYNIIKTDLTRDEAINFAGVMNKLKGII